MDLLYGAWPTSTTAHDAARGNALGPTSCPKSHWFTKTHNLLQGALLSGRVPTPCIAQLPAMKLKAQGVSGPLSRNLHIAHLPARPFPLPPARYAPTAALRTPSFGAPTSRATACATRAGCTTKRTAWPGRRTCGRRMQYGLGAGPAGPSGSHTATRGAAALVGARTAGPCLHSAGQCLGVLLR